MEKIEKGNVRLTLENIQQLAEVEGRLANLVSEIENHSKILKGTKLEAARALKERQYEEEQLEIVSTNLASKKVECTALDEEILLKKSELNALNASIIERDSVVAAKEQAVKNREDECVAKEIELQNKLGEFNQKQSKLDHDKADFESKVAKLKEVISSF